MFTGDMPDEDIRIKVIGVGGAGTNTVDRLKLDSVGRVQLAAVNTDAQALASSPLTEKHMIGRSVTRGLSCGGEPELGRKAAEGDRERLVTIVRDQHLVVVVAGLGGGTGSGSAPVVAEVAAEQGALVVGFVTMPFTTEGKRRSEQARHALTQLRKHCAAVVPLPNDLLLQQVDENASVLDAFSQADEWITTGINALCSMLLNTGLMNVDFEALRSTLSGRSGKTLFGIGRGEGEHAVEEALKSLTLCPLLHVPEAARYADTLVVNITGGVDLGMGSVNKIMTDLTGRFKSQNNTLMGAVIDDSLKQTVEIFVLGTTNIDHPAQEKETAEAPAARKASPAQSPVETFDDDADEQETPVANAAQDDTETPSGSAPESRPAVHASKLHMRVRQEPKGSQEEFLFVSEDEQRGFFNQSERTMFEDEDLDVPTWLRRGVKVPL